MQGAGVRVQGSPHATCFRVWDSGRRVQGPGLVDLSGRGAARAEDAQGTPTQSHISPSITLVYEDNKSRMTNNGFRVKGVVFRVYGSGFRVQVAGFRVEGSERIVHASGIT